MTSQDNNMVKVLQVLAILGFVIGGIAGLTYGTGGEFTLFGPVQGFLGFIVFVFSVVWGIVFLSLAEVIKLLQGIFNQGEQRLRNESSGQKALRPEFGGEQPNKVHPGALLEIKTFYERRGHELHRVQPTSLKNFYLAEVNNQREIVKLGGFLPRILSVEDARNKPELAHLFE